MNNKDQIVLRKIQGHIESILRYCEGIQSLQEFQSNSMRVEATVFTVIRLPPFRTVRAYAWGR